MRQQREHPPVTVTSLQRRAADDSGAKTLAPASHGAITVVATAGAARQGSSRSQESEQDFIWHAQRPFQPYNRGSHGP
jgi:hypothetical protein